MIFLIMHLKLKRLLWKKVKFKVNLKNKEFFISIILKYLKNLHK